MYFPDLTAYSYRPGGDPALNVGWLERGHSFPTGTPDAALLGRILDLAARPRNRTRRWHSCDLCDVTPVSQPSCFDTSGQRVLVGDAEIWVALDGVTYAAPTLICHYIAAHSYQPPPEFVRAVKLGVAP